jgi:RHS repeat-associated protein
VVWQWQSDAFGNGLPNEDVDGDGVSVQVNLRFPGQYYDAESGLHYNYHRYYDPSIGRYITSDPIGLEGGLNTYAYVGGNPVNWVDPYGLEAVLPIPIIPPSPATTGLGSGALSNPITAGMGLLVWPSPLGEGSDIVPLGPYYNEKSRQSKPDGCPTGTLPIDKAKGKFKWGKDDVHGIKDAVGAGPKDWTGASPDGRIWTSDGTGNAIDNGNWKDLIR